MIDNKSHPSHNTRLPGETDEVKSPYAKFRYREGCWGKHKPSDKNSVGRVNKVGT